MSDGKKIFTREEVRKDNLIGKNLLILHDHVYDVGTFLNEHPGGEEVLADQRGKDGSEAFDDVGHSDEAKELMKTYLIGELAEAEKSGNKPKQVEWAQSKKIKKQNESSDLPYGFIAVAAVVLFLAYSLGLFS